MVNMFARTCRKKFRHEKIITEFGRSRQERQKVGQEGLGVAARFDDFRMVQFCHWSMLILRFPVMNIFFGVELCSSRPPRSNVDEQVFISARQMKVAWQNEITTISIFVTGPDKY